MKKISDDWEHYILHMRQKDVCIVDPPWQYGDKELLLSQLSYPLWENTSGLNTLFYNIRTKYLFLWVTNSMLVDVLKHNHNDYVYRTCITWVKTTRVSGGYFYGLGSYFRGCTEHLLLFSHKDAKPLRLSLRNLIIATSSKRTEKPKQEEIRILNACRKKNYTKFSYIFSGPNVNVFEDLDIDVVDIVL